MDESNRLADALEGHPGARHRVLGYHQGRVTALPFGSEVLTCAEFTRAVLAALDGDWCGAPDLYAGEVLAAIYDTAFRQKVNTLERGRDAIDQAQDIVRALTNETNVEPSYRPSGKPS